MQNSGNWGGNTYADSERKKVMEIQEGSVVVEIYEKPDTLNNRLFFDLTLQREYILRDSREKRRGPYLHQRDINDLVIASMSAQKWINGRVREFRSNQQQQED